MNDDKIKNKLISAYNDVDKIFADFSTLMKIVLYSNFGEKISGLYSLIDDNDKFSKLIDVFDGISIEVPNKEEFKSAVSLTLVYYYKEIMGYSWKKIQSLIDDMLETMYHYNGVGLAAVQVGVLKQIIVKPVVDYMQIKYIMQFGMIMQNIVKLILFSQEKFIKKMIMDR